MKRIGSIFLLLPALLAFLATAREAPAQDRTPLKAVLVFDVGGRGDGGFNDAAYNGLEKAVADLGVKAVYVEYKRNLELDRALAEAAVSDAGMIIGVGMVFSERLTKLAAQYPDKRFACVDYHVRYDDRGLIEPLPANLAGLTFREEEGSYLVGALAALTSRTGRIGFVGGMDNPIIRRFQAGYLAGASAVRPDIRVLSRYAGITGHAFNDPQKGYRIAAAMYRQGVDVIYHASGPTGEGVFRAARKMKRLAIGVDMDQSAQAPGLVLTSMTKHVDVAVYESVRSCVEGNFSGGLKSFGLKEKGVGFVYNDGNRKLIPAGVLDRVLALQEKIVAGEVTVPAVVPHRPVHSRKELRDLLSTLHTEIQGALDRLDGDLKRSAGKLAGRDLKGGDARRVLKELYGANPYLIDCETVSDRGIMLAVEPPEHRASEGADISRQAHMVRLFKAHRPVLSGSFRSVEGPDAVVIHHPVFSKERRFAGSVSGLFAPEYLLADVVGPVATNLPVDIFLMQTDGLVIYDVDTAQIGRNVFTDPLYRPFPDLIALARKVAARKEGTGVYRFYQQGGKTPVMNVAYWRTVSLHGVPWRLVITCERESLEKR